MKDRIPPEKVHHSRAPHLWAAALCAGLSALLAVPVHGQAPAIDAFSRNGDLTCTNLVPGRTAVVEWAPTVNGPWTNTWAGLASVVADANGAIAVKVPMFYRVLGQPRTPPGMAWIAPGTFTMGSPDTEPARNANEGPQTQVTIGQGFWIGKYEVTQAEYESVMSTNPSHFKGDLNRPVDSVHYADAVAYCAALTERERTAGRLPAGYAYRLPTEAEWEYCCRAGTTTAFHYGDALRSGMANFEDHYEYPPCGGADNYCYNPSGEYLARTTTVGSYAPNAWGLHDMHGNVYEWCQDWFGAYPGGSVSDPQGPASGSLRIIRGGCWLPKADQCRSAVRYTLSPTATSDSVGFRVVVSQP